MLNLEELVFKVNTKELVEAVTEIENLGKAVGELGSKSASAETKIAKTSNAVKNQSKSVKEVTEETKKNVSVLERQQDILGFMADGFSKGQASILATAKAAGIAAGEMKTLMGVVRDQRTLMGTDPFDKSIGGLQALENELAVVTKAYELHGRQLGLTQKQANELARDYIRLRQQFTITGKDLSGLDAEYEKLVQAEVKVASAQNNLIREMKEQDKTTKETAKANDYLAKEMARVNRMLSDTDNITSTTNNKLIKFEQELRKSGKSAAQQAIELQKYKKALLEIQQAGGNRQVDYLSRALGPQITDVFVGLATGQSPLMVLLQQGGQLRDQFALAGVAGADMGKMLTQAAASMVTSIKDVSMAIGGLFVNVIKAAGNSILDFFVAPFKLAKAAMIDFIYNGNAFEAQVARMQAATAGLIRTLGILATITGGALLIALYQISSAQDDFVRALYQSGATMDMNKQKAIDFSLSMESMGVSSTKAMQALTEIAKSGGFTSESIEGITTAAVNMEKYAGVSIDKTVENFKRLQDKPSEALIELAKNTGYLTVEQVKQIKSFEDVGDKVTAASMAMEAYSRISNQVANEIKANLSPLERAFIDMKQSVIDVWHEFKTWAQESQLLADTLWGLGLIVQTAALGFKVIKAILSGATWPELRDSLTKDAEALRDYFNGTKTSVTGLDSSVRQYNANAIRGFQAQARLADELKGKLDPKEMSKGAYVAAKMQEVLSKTGASFESPAQMQKAIAKYTQEWVDGQKKGNKEVNELDRYMKRIKESVRDVRNETNNLGKEEEQITRAAKLRADLIDDDLWDKVPERVRKQLLAELDVLDATERQFRETEKLKKLKDELFKAEVEHIEKVNNEYVSISESIQSQKKALAESSDALEFQWGLLGKSSSEAKTLTREYEKQAKLKKAEADYTASLVNILTNESLTEQAKINLRARLELNYAEQVRQINSETALLAAKEYEDAFNNVKDTLSDIIATALFEGGKAGQKKLKDLLKAHFRNFVIDVFINPIVKGGLNSILGLVGGGGSASGSIGSIISNGVNDYLTNTALGTVLTSTGGYAAAIGGGSMAAGSQAAMLAAQTAEFGVAGTALTAQAAGSTAGGIASSVMNGLSAIPGWGWAAMAVGALLASGFGKTPGEQHTGGFYSSSGQGTAMGLTGNEAWANDLTKRSNPELTKMVKSTVEGVLSSSNASAKALGLGTVGIDAGFAANTNGQAKNKNAFGYFNITVNGETISEYVNRELGTDVPKAIEKWTADMVEEANKALLKGHEKLAKEGETATQTIDRLSNNLAGVNSAFSLLGKTTLNASMQSAEFASNLVDAFGGLEKFSSAVTTYYSQYYSETERFNNNQRNVISEFAKLNLSVPATTAEFRKLVESQDLTTESGRATYAALLNLAPAFYQVANAIEEVLKSIGETTANSIRDIEMSLLDNKGKYEYLDKEILNYIDRLSKATNPQEIQSLFNSINSNITAAWNLLSDSEKKRLGPEFIKRLEDAEKLAQERLKLQTEQQKKVETAIDKQVTAANNTAAAALEMKKAADLYVSAANVMLEAANKEQIVRVDLSNGSSTEVSFA